MDKVTDKDVMQVSNLADKLLEVVMNTEMDTPATALSALGHVASMISVEVGFPEEVFMVCMLDSFRTVAKLHNNIEVH
jgi:hypothetical protein